MGEQLIKCPKDPHKRYQREVCEKIFRKGNVRVWCKACKIFQDQTETGIEP